MATVTYEIDDIPDVELVESDGEPMDTSWHREAMFLLLDIIRYHFRDRRDYHVGGNNFIYYQEAGRKRSFKGPDFFYVNGVRYDLLRRYWVVWQEEDKYPNVITELLSLTTATEDLTIKKEVYERVFRTPEYFCYDPDKQKLQGWRLQSSKYEPLQPNEHGWLWSEELELWLGTWQGEYQGSHATWLRFYDRDGNLVLTGTEAAAQRAEEERKRAEEERKRAEEERKRAEEERKRAEEAQAEVARLKVLLAEKNGSVGG